VAAKPAGPTKRDRDPADELKVRAKAATTVVGDLVRFAPVFLYFWAHWKPKELVRRWMRIGALSFLSISLILLVLEVVAEFTKHQFIQDFFPPHGPARGVIFVIFVLSVVALLFHHLNEFRHRHSEFLLAERLWEFMMSRRVQAWDDCIGTAVRLFYDVFRRYGVKHVSVALPDENELVIHSQHVFPPEPRGSYFARLPLSDGVAGLVFSDGRPRYVPRMFFPLNARRRWPLNIFFPHAIVFEIRKAAEGRIDVVRPKLDLDAFKPFGDDDLTFRSFVSVPLRAVRRRDTIGVLNIDFDSTDPLARMDIKMAVLLGLLLADELDRLAPAAAAAERHI
jgi:hypothetical protein